MFKRERVQYTENDDVAGTKARREELCNGGPEQPDPLSQMRQEDGVSIASCGVGKTRGRNTEKTGEMDRKPERSTDRNRQASASNSEVVVTSFGFSVHAVSAVITALKDTFGKKENVAWLARIKEKNTTLPSHFIGCVFKKKWGKRTECLKQTIKEEERKEKSLVQTKAFSQADDFTWL